MGVCTNVCVCLRVYMCVCVCVQLVSVLCRCLLCSKCTKLLCFSPGNHFNFSTSSSSSPSHHILIFSYSHFSLSISQPDEDPACFRRIVSYLQLKDLLGDGAPEHVRTVHTLFSPCVSQMTSHSLSNSIFTYSFHFFYLQLLANIFISLGMSRSRFRRTHCCSSRGCSSPSVSRMSSVKFFNLLQKSISQI